MKQLFYVFVMGLFTFIANSAYAQDCNSSLACIDVTQAGSGFGIYSATNTSVAVVGFSESGYGMHGVSAYSNGIQGESDTAGMSGVVGLNGSGSGNGVAGQLSPAGSGSAIYGNNNTSTGWAGNFVGRVWVQTGLDVAGTCVSGNCSSDARLKKNVQPLAKSLATIVSLRPVSFEWRKPNEMERSAGTQVGFLAQDVEQVEPSWVGVDDQGFKTINMNRLTPMLVDSVRELKAENDNLLKGVVALALLVMGLLIGTVWPKVRGLAHR